MRALGHGFFVVVALLAGGVARAEQALGSPPGGAPPQGGEPHQPPPPAFENCAGKTEGTSLMIKVLGGQTVQATCVRYSDGRLFSRPNHPPPFEGGSMAGGGQGPGQGKPN
jgi:hypothetical protein